VRTARAIIVWALLPLAIAGALTLSAAATIGLAEAAGVPPTISPAAVGMLEVVSLTGTLLWVFVGNGSLRRDAVLATVAASLVSLVAGFHAYGLFGAVAPLALVGVVHLASRAWREPWGEDTEPAEPVVDDAPVAEPDEPADPAPVAVSATVRQLRPSPLRQSSANVSRDCVAMPGPSPTWPQPPRNWTYGAQTWRDACEAHYRGMGRPTLMTEFGLTKPNHARQVSDAVRPFKQGEQVRA
jgi:hypothetical protein